MFLVSFERDAFKLFYTTFFSTPFKKKSVMTRMRNPEMGRLHRAESMGYCRHSFLTDTRFSRNAK